MRLHYDAVRRSRGSRSPRARVVPFALLLLLVAFPPFPSPRTLLAQPDDPPAEASEDLFAELLASEGDGAWRGLLNRILQEKDATWIGQVLGRLFRDRVALAPHAACAAYTAAYLADHPKGDRVLLAATILQRASGDDEFVQAMRKHLTKGEGGWQRLLDEARTLLASDDPIGRRAAIAFLSREVGDQRERVRKELLTAARADLERNDVPVEGTRALRMTYLDAFERLLGYRFPSLEEAVRRLTELQDLDLAHAILALSRRKDSPESPLHERVVDYGKRLVDQAAASRKPEALEEFLDVSRTPFTAIRRYAMQRAATMGPEAGAVWGRLLRTVLTRETDAEVLRGALTLLEKTGFAEAAEEAPQLAAALVVRLQQRGPTAAGASDAVEDRVRMARLLGSLRRRPPELDALFEREDSLENEVLAEVVRALGGMENVKTDDLLAHWRRHRGESPRDQAVRVAVVDALGRPGIRAEGGDPAGAAAALREILTGEGEAGLGRAVVTDVRLHAVRSLGGYPGSENADVLGTLATADDPGEARVALVVLRKVAPREPRAVDVLAAVARSVKMAAERRALAVESLGDLGQATPDVVVRAREAVRDVLWQEGAPEVRDAAAQASVNLRDPEAFEALLDWTLEEPGAERTAALRSLLLAVAEDGAGSDDRFADLLVAYGESLSWDAADALARELVQAYPRPLVQMARARVLYEKSGVEEAEAETRRNDVAEALRILDAVAGPDPKGEASQALPLLVDVLLRAGELAPDDAGRKDRYLQAVRRASQSLDPSTLRRGLDVAGVLREPPLGPLLGEEEARQLGEYRARIEKALP